MFRQNLFVAIVVACIAFANAHMFLSNVIINSQATDKCVRPHPQTQYDYPISDKNSKIFTTTPEMVCGHAPALTTKASSKCPINAGSQISLQWWHAQPNDDVVDGTHKGPCIVYMAKSEDGSGPVWFKVYEEGYNPTTKEFCTDRIRKDGPNKGQLTITIPSSLSSGNYLLRSEFLALHEAYSEWGVQPYVGCAELTISGSGSDSPTGVAIPSGLYGSKDEGIIFNVYSGFSSYPIPGPKLFVSGGGSSTPAPTPAPTSGPTTPTNPPSDCRLGEIACPCSGGKYCNTGLVCDTTYNVCKYVECTIGTAGCPCKSNSTCNTGLNCLSRTCVDASSLLKCTLEGSTGVDAIKSSNGAVTLPIGLFAFFFLFVAFLL